MAEPRERTEEAALWERWRSAAAVDGVVDGEPDPLLLAAYAERRLDGAECDLVEEWLAADGDLADDIFAARRMSLSAHAEVPATVVARAAALVHRTDVQVLAFRRPVPRWRAAAVWGGMAASVLVTGLVGFGLGTDAYVNLAATAPTALSQELLDPPTGLFNSADEDSAI